MIDHKPESNGYYVLEQLHLKPENPAEIIKGWVDSYCNMPDFVPFLEDDAPGSGPFWRSSAKHLR